MDNKKTVKPISDVWKIISITNSVQPCFDITNTHQQKPVKRFLNKNEALYFLNDIDDNLRTEILQTEIGNKVSVELKNSVDNFNGHYSGTVTDNTDSLTITGENQDISIRYSQIKKLERIKK